MEILFPILLVVVGISVGFIVSHFINNSKINNSNKKAEEIANKIKKGREKIAKLKGEDGSNIFSQYLSSLSIGLHLPIHAFLDYTVYQLFDAVERLSLYTNWDIDIRSRLAGAQSEEKPENWMRDIHKN